MRLGVRGGHTYNSYGSVGVIDEYVENRKVYKRVVELLNSYHTVIDCTPSDELGYGEWNTGVNKANNSNLDLFFSVHFNSASGDAQGTEVCVYPTDEKAKVYGNKICENISKLGFRNRGIKHRTDLAETVNIKCPSMVVEVCFVQKSDAELYKKVGVEKIARAIANAIDSRISLNETSSPNTPQASVGASNLYRIRLSWEDIKSQKGAYSDLNNAIKECSKYSGYKVYDNSGKQVYPINADKTKLIKSYVEKGKATVTGAISVNVRNSYCVEENNVVAKYNNGEIFYYDYVYITEYKGVQYIWCSYISLSGIRRYVCAKEGNVRYLTCI